MPGETATADADLRDSREIARTARWICGRYHDGYRTAVSETNRNSLHTAAVNKDLVLRGDKSAISGHAPPVDCLDPSFLNEPVLVGIRVNLVIPRHQPQP